MPPWGLQNIFGAGDEDAGAARLAPDAVVARSRRTVVVVARKELALVDPQLAIEEMQLFDARMRMRRITRATRQAHQHADPVPFRVGREQLAFDPGRDLFPFRLGPSLLARARRRQHRFFPGLLRDTTRKPRLQRCRRTQHIGRPGNEPVDHRAQALQFAPAIRAGGDMRFSRGNLARGQDLQGIRAGCLAMPAAVRLPDPGGMRALHTPNYVKRELSDWSGARGAKKAPLPARAAAH